MKKILLYFSLAVILTSCASKFSKIQKSKDYQYKVKMAEQFYAKKKYRYAQILFEEVFPFIKGTAQFEDTYYKFAYCYFYDNDFVNAENLFKNFVETFPSSSKAEECEYMRAFCFYKQSPKVELDQTNTHKSIGLMQAFINTHPTSERVKDASNIIDLCREKLELKDFKSAELYYNLGFYKAAAISYSSVSENFPDSKRADEYKFLVIKSYYKYAEMSIPSKQEERFEKVLTECADFTERFQDSKYLKESERYKNLSTNFIKKIKNEQIKKTA
ncbi:MAG: outer membrane protein assembly factor BamD [Chitinophagaceae bacterium]|nr:outer membrane protein assembly factor BamD [Chitinophagaceae bacterium]MCW5905418.1 outer membrane protein assembly factor BamD [Chitinophagaceae bacterium]